MTRAAWLTNAPDAPVTRATVWADGYGRWHASVPISGNARRDMLHARRLIAAELEARGAGAPVRFRVTRERVTNHGSVIYGEPLTGGR